MDSIDINHLEIKLPVLAEYFFQYSIVFKVYQEPPVLRANGVDRRVAQEGRPGVDFYEGDGQHLNHLGENSNISWLYNLLLF